MKLLHVNSCSRLSSSTCPSVYWSVLTVVSRSLRSKACGSSHVHSWCVTLQVFSQFLAEGHMQKGGSRLSAQFWARAAAFTALSLTIGNSQLTFSKLSNWEKDRAKFNLEIPTSLFMELFSFIWQATKKICRKQEYFWGKNRRRL